MHDYLAKKYDKIAEGFTEKSYANLSFYMHRRFILATSWMCALQAGDSVLELGCGDGYLAEMFARHGFSYSGVDISSNMVAIAERRLQLAGLSANFAVADVNKMVVKEPYDAIISYMRAFFSYVQEPLTVLKHLRSYVRKKLIVDLNPRGRFSLHEAIAIMHAAGFQDVMWRPFFVPIQRHIPHWLLHLLISSEDVPLVRSIPLRWKFHCLLQGRP